MAAPHSAAADIVRIGGTGMALGLAETLGKAFARKTGEHRVVVPPSLGSSGGIRALRDGALEIALSARPLKDSEAAAGLRQMIYAHTPFVLATSHPKPDAIEPGELQKLYREPAAHWQDGQPVRVVLRQQNESDNTLLAKYFPGMDQALAVARTHPAVPVAVSDQDNLRLTMAMAGSLTATTLMQVIAEAADLRLLRISGIAPTAKNLENGTYPYSKTLYLVLPSQPTVAAAAFIRFIQSPEARAIAAREGALAVQ